MIKSEEMAICMQAHHKAEKAATLMGELFAANYSLSSNIEF